MPTDCVHPYKHLQETQATIYLDGRTIEYHTVNYCDSCHTILESVNTNHRDIFIPFNHECDDPEIVEKNAQIVDDDTVLETTTVRFCTNCQHPAGSIQFQFEEQ